MEDYPRSLAEFEACFLTEAACLDYWVRLRWPDGFVCPRCQGAEAWQTNRGLWHCRQCGKQTSVTAGTIFHRTRKPLQLWFRAMWHITSQKYGANALGLQRVLGLGNYKTAWEWLHKHINSAGQWCGRAEIDSRGVSKSMRRTWVAASQGLRDEAPKGKLW